MSRMLLVSCLVLLVTSAALAQAPESQSIAGLSYETPHYQLRVFAAGHFAVKIGGSWMPGCICLNINGTPQYKQEALSHMASTVERTPDGRKMTVTGRLTPDFAFTQTLVMSPQAVELTYVVEALRTAQAQDISITAGPQLDQAKGLQVQIDAASGPREFTFPPAAPGLVGDVRSITWRNLSQRDARTTFVRAWKSSVSVSDKSATYTALLARDRELKQGDKLTGIMRFEALPIGEAVNLRQSFQDRLGFTRFGVSGLAGLLNNVRTDQGLLIQQLSINEDDVHQVQVGRGKVPSWGGVYVPAGQPGAFDITSRGKVVSDWEERVQARTLSPAVEEIHWSAKRQSAANRQRLRVLMYVAQWLEQERNPYFIRLPDGTRRTDSQGDALWFGMPPQVTEAGLGPYRKLGQFPAGTEIVVPMLRRGELMTVRTHQPLEIDGFRFEIYFRGLWFEALDKTLPQLDFDVTVEKLPLKQVGPLTVCENPWSGAAGVREGGMPLLEAEAVGADGKTASARWEWASDRGGASGRLRAAGARTVRLKLPGFLQGKPVTVQAQAGAARPLLMTAGRIGAVEKPIALQPGADLSFAPTALDRVTIRSAAAAQATLSKDEGGQALLTITGQGADADVTVRYAAVTAGAPQAASPAPAGEQDTLTGLKAETLANGDVVVSTPWWQVVHASSNGGAIRSLTFANGSNQSVLREPIATSLSAGGDYTDTRDANARLQITESRSDYVKLLVTGKLLAANGQALCPFEHVYEYRPMLVRRTCRYLLGDRKVACTRLAVGSMTLSPSLDECAFRREKERTTWARAVFPGPPAFEEKGFSQYMCLFRRGVEGIDWLPACDLNQWQRFGGRKDAARYAICGAAEGAPQIIIEPLALTDQPLALTGTLQFESFLSLPQVKRCLPRRNFVACLDTGQCTEQMLRLCADYGVTDILLGCGNTPGSFQLSDLKASQQAVQRARAVGIKVYPFDPFQLVNRRAPLWQQHETMAREELRNGVSTPMIYPDGYGDYFCPQSRDFRDALKAGYTKLVESADFGGLYHDFTHPYICTNTRHHPSPHLNTDGVLDMILWERQFLGPDRVFCGHTGWVPALFFQDLCTVTAVFEEYPSTEPLPLHLTPAQGEFVNAAQMTLVSSFLYHGAAAPGEEGGSAPAPELVDAYLSRCALTGIFPWAHSGNVGAEGMYDLPDKLRPWLRLFALRGNSDLGTMQFLPWHRQTAVQSSSPFVRAATYWNRDRAIIVIANSESGHEQPFSLAVQPEQFGWPQTSKLSLTPAKDSAPLKPLGGNRFEGKLPGFGWAAYEVRR